MPSNIASLSDADLLNVATQMNTVMTATPALYGVSTTILGDLANAITDFSTGLSEHVNAQATAKAKTISKDTKRTTLESVMRGLRDTTKAHGTSDSLIADLGLPSGGSTQPSNATQPIGEVDTSERMRHTIVFYDKAANGNKRRPRGAVGCEIWVKIGDPAPTSEKDCTFLSLDTQTPYVSEYEPTDANKTAHYLLRWQMRDGSKSAWSETVSATITA